jgi:hypothetical protein
MVAFENPRLLIIFTVLSPTFFITALSLCQQEASSNK